MKRRDERFFSHIGKWCYDIATLCASQPKEWYMNLHWENYKITKIRHEEFFNFIYRELRKEVRYCNIVISNDPVGYSVIWLSDPANAIDKNFIPDNQLLNF